MPEVDGLDVVLRLSNLRRFQAGLASASKSIREVGAATKMTNAEMATTGKRSKGMVGSMGLVARAAKTGALALAAMAFESVHMGIKFDQQMTMIRTQSGGSAKEVANLRKEILNMNSAFSPLDMARAAKDIVGIGFSAARNLEILHAASEGAAQGNAAVEETAKTLAGVMKTQIPGALGSAEKTMAILNATVGTGVMTLDDLNHALGTGILPVAKEYGLTIDDITGALAVFTDEHIQGSSATAQLATSLHFLTGATKKGREGLKSIGLTGEQMAAELHGPRGLLNALTLLQTHLDAYGFAQAKFKEIKTSKGVTLRPANAAAVEEVGVLDQILPGGRGRILRVLLNQLKNYGQKIDQQHLIRSHAAEHHALTEKSAAIRIREAWHGVQREMIKLSDVIQGPVGGAVLGLLWIVRQLIIGVRTFAGWIGTLVKGFQGLPEPVRLAGEALLYTAAAIGLILALGYGFYGFATAVMVATFAMWDLTAASVAFLVANPLLLGIALLAAAVVLVVTHWSTFKKAAIDAWHWVTTAARNTWQWIKNHWPLILSILTGPIGAAVIYIVRHWGKVKAVIGSVKDWVVDKMKGVGRALAAPFVWLYRHAIKPVISAIKWVAKHAGDVKDAVLPGGKHGLLSGQGLLGIGGVPILASGGTAMMSGTALVGDAGPELIHMPRGATVQPLTRGDLGPSGDINVRTQVILDRRVLAEAIGKAVDDRRARA